MSRTRPDRDEFDMRETKVRGTGPFSALRGLLVSFVKVIVVLVGAEQWRADTFDCKIEESRSKWRFQFEIRRSVYRA